MTRQPINLYEKALFEFRRTQKNNKIPTIFDYFRFDKNMLDPLQKMGDNFLKPFKNMNYKFDIQKQVNSFVKNLTNSFNKFTNAKPTEDYNEILHRFIPENAKLITPLKPLGAGPIRFADIDGDMQKELIASCISTNEVKTVVLKKHNDGNWRKLGEIIEPDYCDINYLGFPDLSGAGRRQLLIGKKGDKSSNVLHCYDFSEGKFNKIFTQDYSRFEVIGEDNSRNATGKKNIAVWRRNSPEAFDVDIMNWNGKELIPVENKRSYYINKVIPYYTQRINQKPNNPNSWYLLANALVNSGIYKEGSAAANYGLRLKPDDLTRKKLEDLKSRINDR